MAINPSAIPAYQGIQVENPLNMYAKVAAIQQAQQQNELARLQMDEYARTRQEEADVRNYLMSNPDLNDPAVRNRLLGYGKSGQGIATTYAALGKAALEGQELRGKIRKQESDAVDAALKRSREFLGTIDPTDPDAPQQFMNWHQGNHADPVLGPVLAARGITPEQTMARIQQAVAGGPAAFAQLLRQSQLGVEKFIEMNKPVVTPQNLHGSVRMLSTPGLGGAATVVPGSEAAVTATPAETENIRLRGAELKVRQGLLKVAQDRLAQETDNGKTWSPESIQLAAHIYLQTGAFPPVGSGKVASATRDAIMQEAYRIQSGAAAPAAPAAPAAAPGAAAPAAPAPSAASSTASAIVTAKQDKAAQTSALRDFASGPSARRVTANNTALNHLDTLSRLATDLNNADTRVVNAAANAFARTTGSPAPTNFDAAKQLVAAEVIKAVVNNGGGVTERQEAEQNFARANSPAQLQGVIKTYKELLGGQLASLGQQYETGTGRKDFASRLSPATRELYAKGSGTPAAPDASKPAPAAPAVPQAAIDLLKSGKGTREQFDAIFGAGAAERVLGKK